MRRKENWLEVLHITDQSEDINQFLKVVNEKGPSVEVLFFVDYFSQFNKSPLKHT
jgi:hypothetical protein